MITSSLHPKSFFYWKISFILLRWFVNSTVLMRKLVNDQILASVLSRKDSDFLREHFDIFLTNNVGLKPSLHLEALYQCSLLFLASSDYKESFQAAFLIKEIARDSVKGRLLIVDLIEKFVETEIKYITPNELHLLVNEVSTQYSFLKIYGYPDNVTHAYNGLLYILREYGKKINTNKVEGRHQSLFIYLGDLFLRSNSSVEAWDRAAIKIIDSHSI